MINVHNGWDSLEEVWLGDVYPKEFYEDLSTDLKKAFNQITDWTKEDLNVIEDKLKELGVKVKRPFIDVNNKQLYLDSTTLKLKKPPICLRDNNTVVGNHLFFKDTDYPNLIEGLDSSCLRKVGPSCYLSGASIVKVGRDLLFDAPMIENQHSKDAIFYNFYHFQDVINLYQNDYRIYYATNGGHCDGAFMPIKFGLSLSTEYATGYDFFLPEWTTIEFPKHYSIPNFYGTQPLNFRWKLPKWTIPDKFGHSKQIFNEYLEEFCTTWIGNYRETYFEVNVLAIDEENLMCIGDEKNVYPYIKQIEKHGIKCHVVPFRTRSFWDGGVHCLTLDTKRKGNLNDYYPERGEYGLKSVTSSLFNNSEDFLTQYHNWISKKDIDDLSGGTMKYFKKQEV